MLIKVVLSQNLDNKKRERLCSLSMESHLWSEFLEWFTTNLIHPRLQVSVKTILYILCPLLHLHTFSTPIEGYQNGQFTWKYRPSSEWNCRRSCKGTDSCRIDQVQVYSWRNDDCLCFLGHHGIDSHSCWRLQVCDASSYTEGEKSGKFPRDQAN